MPPHGQDGSHLYFTDFINSVGKLQAEQNPIFNDVVVFCGNGNNASQCRMPGIVLAAICPVFKVIYYLSKPYHYLDVNIKGWCIYAVVIFVYVQF